jgi:hypothetical protein
LFFSRFVIIVVVVYVAAFGQGAVFAQRFKRFVKLEAA